MNDEPQEAPNIGHILIPTAYPLNTTFGFPDIPDEMMANGFAIPEPETLEDQTMQYYAWYLRSRVPAVDPDYQFRPDLLNDIRAWWEADMGDVLYLWGATGSGKTSLIEQWCARLEIPLFSAKGHARFDASEAFGQFVGGEGGTTPWIDGDLTMAARFGLPFLLNEADRIKPASFIVFNDVFEGRAFALLGKPGDMVIPQPGFRVILTGNTNMVEDESGMYGTTASHDMSLLDRLYAVHVPYAEESVEKNVVLGILREVEPDLLSYFTCEQEIRLKTDSGFLEGEAIPMDLLADNFVKLAQEIRKYSMDTPGSDAAAIERTMSTRTLKRYVRYALAFSDLIGKNISPLHYAMDRVLASCSTSSSRLVLHSAVEKIFNVPEQLVP
jgi:cobaltochelatase CobS